MGAWIALGGLALALLCGGGGYWWGHGDGEQAERGKQAISAVDTLKTTLDKHAELVDDTNQASAALRLAMAQRAASDRNFSKEFRNALKATADERADCRFDDGIVRQLGAARDRAAEAAASGSAAAVR